MDFNLWLLAYFERFGFLNWQDTQIVLDEYVKLLQRNEDLEAQQVQALCIGERICKLLRENSESWGGGVGMQDILDILKFLNQGKSNPSRRFFHYHGYFGTHWINIMHYYDGSYRRDWIDSLRSRITPIQSFLIQQSSELSTLIEEIFTSLEENSSFIEKLSTIFKDDLGTQGPTEHHSVAYAVVVSAVVLLCFVYQYLMGYVDRGGSKADSSGSLEFRDTYISIVLFQGSYIWIKSRDVAPTPIPIKEHATHRKDGVISVKFEPRFKPRKENGVNFNRTYLGQFPTRIEAEVVFRTAASCYEYGQHYGPQVDLGGGRFFTIPALREDEQGLSGMKKVEMVRARAKRVHEAFVEVWNSPSALPGTEIPQQLLLQGIQVSGGNALLQLPSNQTQNSGMMEDISMQGFQAHHIMQSSQLPCQDISHVPQQMVEKLTRQNLELQQVVQRQELQLQQQTRELKIYRALRKRRNADYPYNSQRGSTCKKSGRQRSARKLFSGLPQDLVLGPLPVQNLQDQDPESTHLQQWNEELMAPILRLDGVPESADLESAHLEEVQSWLAFQMAPDQPFLEFSHLQQDASCVNGGDGGMSDEEPRMETGQTI